MTKKQIFSRILASTVFLIIICLFFLSTFIRNYIVKNGEELVGRNMSVGEIHINYATVALTVNNFVLFEPNRIDTFVSFSKFHFNLQPWKLFQHEYAVSVIELDSFYISVEQDGSHFNFDDLIPASDSIQMDTIAIQEEANDVQFYIENISFTNGKLKYLDREIDNKLVFHNLDLRLPLLAWNNQKSNMGVDFNIGQNGHLKVSADINHLKSEYLIHTLIDSVELQPFTNYLKPYMLVSDMEGVLSSELFFHGSMVDVMNIVISGSTSIDQFSLSDNSGVVIAKVNKAYVELDSLDLLNNYYYITKAALESPKLVVEIGKEMTNLEHFFSPLLQEDTLTIEDTAIVVDEATMEVHYLLDSVIINNGFVDFTDKTLNRDFNYQIASLNVDMVKLSDDADQVPVTFTMRLNNEGVFKGKTLFSMLNTDNYSFDGAIEKLHLQSLSPYSEYYIARSITGGLFSYDCKLEMSTTNMKNDNSFVVDKLDFSKNTGDKTAIKAPVRLGLYILKDKNDRIAFDLPVWGNPSDPEFRVKHIIWQTLANFIIKTATQPFSALASMVGADPESIKQIPFDILQDSLSNKQTAIADKISAISHQKPELIFTLTQIVDAEYETKMYAMRQVVIDYLFTTYQPKTASDSIKIVSRWFDVCQADTAFSNYISTISGLSDTISVADRCSSILGDDKVKSDYITLIEQRNKLVKDYLITIKQTDRSCIVVETANEISADDLQDKPYFDIQVSLK